MHQKLYWPRLLRSPNRRAGRGHERRGNGERRGKEGGQTGKRRENSTLVAG